VSIREIVEIGEPVLRERAREIAPTDLATPQTQQLVDDLVDTMRRAGGAGLAAPQVGVSLRIFVVEVSHNPRYPYKPEIPLRILVNPVLRSLGSRSFPSYEGCLSVPQLRGLLERHADIEVSYLDRHGQKVVERITGLSAGTFQHELDHLDGVLFLDRVADPRTFTTWDSFRRFHETAWLDAVRPEIERASIKRM
jgi:peptide deformylase